MSALMFLLRFIIKNKKSIKRIINIVKTIIIIIIIIMAVVGLIFVLGILNIIDLSAVASSEYSTESSSFNITDVDVKEVMAMSDEEAWKGLTGGLLTDIPAKQDPSNASAIQEAVEKQIVDITVPTRAWKDDKSMDIIKKDRTFQVNKLLAKFWTAFLTDLYNECPDFVITEWGGFRIDRVGDGGIGFRSGHTYGAAIDFNWSTKGMRYEDEPISKKEWEKLSESREKYQIIYQNSPMVKLAYKYTLKWGGEFTVKDCMHFSFICDGETRSQRIQHYGNNNQ